MNAKERAVELYIQHIELAKTDGRAFRKTVMEQLMQETGCSLAAAATHYNNAKKANPVEGLGRQNALATTAKKVDGTTAEVDDNDCFSVLEINNGAVGRCQSFIMQGDASETFDAKVMHWPQSVWVMIQGLGPVAGETYKLEPGEKEIKRHTPVDA